MILYNAVRCKDGAVIESKHRHDFVCHKTEDGTEVCVDGGKDYLRRAGDLSSYEELSVDSDDLDFSEVRKWFTWATYGKNGDEPLQYKPLGNMTTNHIIAILDTQKHISKEVRGFMLQELEFRGVSYECT